MRALIPKFFVRCAALAFLLPLSSASAASVTYIDLLDTTQTNTTYNSSATNTVASAGAVGGFRTLSLSSTGNDINDDNSTLRIMTNAAGGGPRLSLGSGNDATASFQVTWGGANGTAGLGGIDFRAGITSTNFNLTNSTLNFSLRSADFTNSVTWTFTDTNNTTATYTTLFPAQLPPAAATSFAISLASFTGANSIDWSAINFISLSGGGLQSLDLALTGPFSVTATSIVTGPVDTDGDGVNDYRENADGTNPNDANSFNSLSKGLVAFYPFANSLDDFSGYQNNFGTNFTGISFAAGRTGSGNTSVEFKNADASAVSGKNIGIAGNQKHAFSFWFYTPSTPSWPQGEGAVVTMGTGNGYGKISQIFIDDATSGRIVAHGGYADLEKLSMGNAFAGRWNHVVFVYTGSVEASAIYLNGRQLSATPWSGGNRSNFRDLEDAPLLLGRTPSQVSHLKAAPGGRVSDLRVYSRELSSAEVMALYAYEAGNLDSDGDGLIDVHETNTGTYVSPTDTGSDLFIPDSDNDGFNDGVEVDAGSDPNNASSVPGFADSDGDGVNNYRENVDGTNPNDPNSFNLLSKGLVAYYPFDGSTEDRSGFQNHASANGNTQYLAAGLSGGALRTIGDFSLLYNGGGWVQLPLFGADMNSSFSFSFWAKDEESGGDPVHQEAYISFGQLNSSLVEVGLSGINGNYAIWQNNPGDRVESTVTSNAIASDKSWKNFVLTYAAGTLSLYRNGILIWSASGTKNIFPVQYAALGRHWWENGTASSARMSCTYDNVRIYNRALSGTEVGSLYQSESGALDSDGDGLTDAWERGFGRYQVVEGDFAWDEAKADAEARGGHLATLTSEGERMLVMSLFSSETRTAVLPWLGASDAAVEGDWKWITGETWGYTYWSSGNPDNGGGVYADQDYLWAGVSLTQPERQLWMWDDYGKIQNSIYQTGYLLEYGYPTDPLDPDSDDDGFNDAVESYCGADPNNAAVTPNSIRPSGRVTAWGDTANNATAVPASLGQAIQVSTGGASYALKPDGTIVAWGSLWNGGSFVGVETLLPSDLTNVVAVDAGSHGGVALKGDGTVVAWGYFWSGTGVQEAYVPEGLGGVVQVSMGVSHATALKGDGTVVSWGFNNYGETVVPVGLSDVVQVSAGGYHSTALKGDGTVVAWGQSDHPIVAQVPGGLASVVKVSAGGHFTLALKSDGAVVGWGLSDVASQAMAVPVELVGVADVDASVISANAAALKSDGTIVPWGDDTYGQNSPPALDQVLQAAAGSGHSVALHNSSVDSDGDGIFDDYETDTGTFVSETNTGTDPLDSDSDDDGFNDNVEIGAGSDPNNASSVPGFADSDGDGVNNFRENADGTNPNDANSFNPLSKGLVAYYPFDGSANDESGYANHGTAYESQSSADRFGLPAKAWRFNASSHSSNSRVVIAKAEQHNFQNELTVSLWARFNEPWSYKVEHLIWNRPAYQNYGWGMAFNQDDSAYGSQKYNGGGFGVVTSGGGLEIVNNSTAWSFGQMSHWRHYLAVFGGGRLKIYVDGVLVGDRAINGQILNGPADLIIGGCDNSPYANNRDVDDVRVYKRALSATEVEHLYLSEVPVVYVDAAATGAGDGSSWQDAYTDLQSALVAAQPGWQIWVAKGTYKPSSTGDRNASFALKSAVSLYGGFAGTETSPQQRDIPSNPTILSGDLLGNDNATLAYSEPTRSENSFHIVEALNLTESVILDGFVLKAGHANQGLSGADSVGSCLYVEGSNLMIRNCEFRDTFGVKGPSIYDMGGGNISIESCTFKSNKAFSVGSVHLASDFLIKDSAFVGNSALDSPYGYQWGGALFIVDVTGSVVNSVFADNYAAEDGGAVYSHGNTAFVNCTFSGNESATTGTAVMDRQKEAVFQNCIFWGNSGGQGLVGLPGAGLVIASADPYGGPASIGLGGPAKNSIVQGGYAAPGSVNIITGDPAFYSATNPLGVDGVLGTSDDGLQIMGWSPALEAGDNSFVPADITTDIAGAPRIVGTVDLGAYEGAKILDPAGDEDGDGILNGAETNSGVYTSTSDTGTNPLKPDTDGDGLTDGMETNTGSFVSASNTGTNPLAADTNADGITDGEAVTWNFNPLLDQTPFLEFIRFAVGQSGGRFGVFTQGQHDANRTNGQADVTGSPADYNLFTQAQYDANRATGRLDVTSNPMSYGLYTADSIMDLRMGGLMIQRQGTNAVISFQPQTTTDLALPFTNNGTPITHQIPMPGNKGFIRIRANP